jgi:SAM-dependent methyltransferase
MSSYAGRHAELYDLFYTEKRYEDEARFVHTCLGKFAIEPTRNILELACGTGRHAFELEKYSYEITATDSSVDMLRIARERAKELRSKVEFGEADMQRLRAPTAPYDAAICLFDSIGYLQTNEALAAAFQGINQNLRSNGLFVFEFWHAAAMLSQYSPLRIRRWNTPHGEVLRISETSLDPKNQLAKVAYTVYELRKDGTYSSFAETQTNRYFLVQEMEALLSAAGLEILKFFAGFQEDESITAQTWHVVGIARKI